MLLPDNIHPENSIYYNGAMVLQVLQSNDELSLIELYQNVREIQNMSFPIFVLCLDWLYLINVAELNEGKVKLCS
ncbi:MAG: ABC-three component system middle component 6 [Thermotogota bacterium]